MVRGPDDDDTATAASATGTGVDIGTGPHPATTAPLADEHISSFLRQVRRRAADEAAGLVLGAAHPDTGTDMAADPAPGVAVLVVAAGPTTDMDAAGPTTGTDAGTADGLFPAVADFDPASAWGDGDAVTTTIPGGADFDPTSLGSAWVDADDATTGVITADPGTDIDVGTAGDLFPDVVDFEPTGARKRKRSQRSASAAPSHTWRRSGHRHGFWRLAVRRYVGLGRAGGSGVGGVVD